MFSPWLHALKRCKLHKLHCIPHCEHPSWCKAHCIFLFFTAGLLHNIVGRIMQGQTHLVSCQENPCFSLAGLSRGMLNKLVAIGEENWGNCMVPI
jgi:hypothetical protein